MFGLESRVIEIERRLRKALQDIADLLARMTAAEQQKLTQQPGAGGGTSSPVSVYFADHLTLAGVLGLLPTSPVPPSTTGDVYRITSGAFVLDTSGATIYNGIPDATDNTKRQFLGKNTDGTFSVIGQSCTSP